MSSATPRPAPRAGRSTFSTAPRAVPIAVALGLALTLLVACDDEEGSQSAGSTTTPALGTGIDREAILNEVEQVRAMFAQSSALDAELLQDVSYEDDRLRVTLGPDASGTDAADAATRAEQVCTDLAEAMQLPDLRITVHSAGGDELAACTLGP